MPNTRFLGAAAAAMLLAAGCGRGGNSDRQEVIKSLRSFGMSASPLVPSPSEDGKPRNTAQITFYAAVPLGRTATLAPFTDASAGSGSVSLAMSDIVVVPGSEAYKEYSGFRLFSAQVTVNLPPASAFRQGPAFAGGQLRYGLTVTSEAEHEHVVGNLLVFPAGSPETAWQNPAVNIAAPTDGAAMAIGDNLDLKATVTNAPPASTHVGWFVTSGEVSNRHAADTKWKLTDKGPQTVAVTIHDTHTRGFALKVIDVTGQ